MGTEPVDPRCFFQILKNGCVEALLPEMQGINGINIRY